jgi:hypothetical protein
MAIELVLIAFNHHLMHWSNGDQSKFWSPFDDLESMILASCRMVVENFGC